ncbi:MAG: c-type cytochrome [Bacteroidetes bacterium]|jgi:mono/diheme cytochrome c family protein|nr:c-type cytochrome [Bacteroidota bacterium]
MNYRKIQITLLALAVSVFTACGGGSSEQESADTEQPNEEGLTEFELEHGIGPVTEVVELGELDRELAAQGKEVYEAKCTACHKPTERYIGPASNDILDRRSPAYIMNMIMNPDEMTKKHPEGKKMMQEYMAPMPYQNVTVEQARAIVEYFRTLEDENEQEKQP